LPSCKEPQKGEKPDGKLTEKIYYDYSADGFSAVKHYLDKNGNVIEEHLYGIDETLGILAPTAIATNTHGEDGKIAESKCRYLNHALNAQPERLMTLTSSDNQLYDYRVINASGATLMYVCETTDANGNPTKTDYYTPGGRLTLTSNDTYRENGTRLCSEAYDAEGTKLYSCKYNENGSFTEAEVFDGVETVKVSAEYYENGFIKSYTEKKLDKAGGYVYAPFTVDFNEKGNVTKYKDTNVYYDATGEKLTAISTRKFDYTVDENGRITEKNSKPNTANPTKTLYTYDEKGRMTSEKTSNKGVTVSSKTYTWNSDGTYDVAIRNNGVLDQITKFNASGLPTRADNYQSGKVIYYTESKYDASDRLVKAEYYLNGNLKGSLSYEYNVHGDVTVEKKSGSYGFAHNEYEYDETGKLTLATIYSQSGTKSQSTEYLPDGSQCVTKYDGIGGYTATTVNDKGVITKYEVLENRVKTTVFYEYHSNGNKKLERIEQDGKLSSETLYREDGKPTQITAIDENGDHYKATYEYHSNGKEKYVATYKNGILFSAGKYNSAGNVEELTVTDENGNLSVSKYTRENGIPTRIDVYTEGKLTAYTLIEYFTYKNDQENNVKSIRTYDEDGLIALNMEYEDIYVYYKHVYVLVKEEVFQGGELIAYSYIEYDKESGNPVSSKEALGSLYIETTYSTKTYGYIIEQKKYSDGVLVSIYGCESPNVVPPTYIETFYGADGKITHVYEYASHSEEPKVVKEYVYEYLENGNYRIASYFMRDNVKCIGNVKEYRPDGTLAYGEYYSYYTSYTQYYSKEFIYYNEKELPVRSLQYTGDGKYLEEENLNEYGSNNKVIKHTRIVYRNNEVDQIMITECDENGKMTYSSHEFKDGRKSETFITYDKNGDVTERKDFKNGELSSHYLKEFDENGNVIRIYDKTEYRTKETIKTYNSENLVKEIFEYENDALVKRIAYEYHTNGQMSSVISYDAAGNVINKTFYDEDGNYLPSV
jgi:antitoxin component YwqK of YwqJK toxin-antitoxin module